MQSDVGVMLHRPCCAQAFVDVGVAGVAARSVWHRGYGATVARLTPDQKVGSSNLSVLILYVRAGGGLKLGRTRSVVART